jgi:hypothetical protein
MKIALCLSGEPRDFHYIWPDLLTKLNCPDAHIYIHTWFSDKVTSNMPPHKERGGLLYEQHTHQSITTEYIYSTLPRKFLVEDFYHSIPYLLFKDFNLPSTISRMYSMYFGIQSVVNMINFSDYDIIIRMRPDIFLENKLNWPEISEFLNANPFSILIPELWFNIGASAEAWTSTSTDIPDFFCIYKSNSILFTDIYDKINRFCGLHIDKTISDDFNLPSIPEIYLASYFKSKLFIPTKMNLKMMLARHHKQIMNNEPVF